MPIYVRMRFTVTEYTKINYLNFCGCFCRNFICSLWFHVQEQSQAVPVHLETVWFRSASYGDEDLDGSGRDDKESAREARSSFWHETTHHVVCGKYHDEHAVWSSIRSLWSIFPAAHNRYSIHERQSVHGSWVVSCTSLSSVLQEADGWNVDNSKENVQLCQEQHRCLLTGL